MNEKTFLIQEQDDMVQSINLIMKFPKGKYEFYKALTLKYKKNPKDLKIVEAYAFYNYYDITQIVQACDLDHTGLKEVLDCYDRILLEEPEHYFVHILRILLCRRLPVSRWDRLKYLEELKELIRFQDTSKKIEGYFMVPYLFLSEYYMFYEKEEVAFEILMQGRQKVTPVSHSFQAINIHFLLAGKEILYQAKRKGNLELAQLLDKSIQEYLKGR